MKPISLSKARKERSRKEKRAKANANAVRFGRTKSEKSLEKTQRGKAERDLDGHKRER